MRRLCAGLLRALPCGQGDRALSDLYFDDDVARGTVSMYMSHILDAVQSNLQQEELQQLVGADPVRRISKVLQAVNSGRKRLRHRVSGVRRRRRAPAAGG
jgi:hypothetical protein